MQTDDLPVRHPERSLNWYLADPCFINAIERCFAGTRTKISYSLITLGELEALYAFWKDGFALGEYSEATKDAEGS